jgi:hypothetical protein
LGAWGTGAFENDDAADWLAELESAEDDAPLLVAFDAALVDGYLELPEAGAAVAAAEVVAGMLGSPAANSPEFVMRWISQHRNRLRPGTAQRARGAVTRVASDSEMRDLWVESESASAWEAAIADLQRRLAESRSAMQTEAEG